jgi:hypothetical protein
MHLHFLFRWWNNVLRNLQGAVSRLVENVLTLNSECYYREFTSDTTLFFFRSEKKQSG